MRDTQRRKQEDVAVGCEGRKARVRPKVCAPLPLHLCGCPEAVHKDGSAVRRQQKPSRSVHTHLALRTSGSSQLQGEGSKWENWVRKSQGKI